MSTKFPRALPVFILVVNCESEEAPNRPGGRNLRVFFLRYATRTRATGDCRKMVAQLTGQTGAQVARFHGASAKFRILQKRHWRIGPQECRRPYVRDHGDRTTRPQVLSNRVTQRLHGLVNEAENKKDSQAEACKSLISYIFCGVAHGARTHDNRNDNPRLPIL